MADDADSKDTEDPYIGGVGSGELDGEEQLRPTPEQHEQLKNGLHGEPFEAIKRAERRYLVIGRGDDAPGKRRREVCRLLDGRVGATAFRLEDFGFTSDELELWAPAFEILSEMASYIVGVLEDFDGGHVWELGFLYHQQTHVRDILWLLKRIYENEERTRDRYDNGMAASHLAALEDAAGDRVVTWEDPADLSEAVESIP